MYARLTTIVFAPTEPPDIAATIYEQIVPTVQEFDGFKGMLMLAGLDERRLAVLTLWETAEALEAAQPLLEGVKRAETAFRQVESQDTVSLYVAGSQLQI